MTNHFRRQLTVTSVVAILGVCTYSLLAADKANKTESSNPDFTGKFVVVIIDQSSAVERRQNTEVLTDVAMRQIGGRYFIVGKAYQPESVSANWRTGSEVGVAWEKVHVYYAYTPEQFKNYSKRWADSEDKEEKDDK
jgi:hypothetical protein